jgi:large subunit ribosomal protein L16
MLQPRRTRFRKHHKPPFLSPTNNKVNLVFGDYGIQSTENGRISARHLEAVRRVCARICRRQGRIWIRLYPDWVISQKSAESRMGKGKGAPTFWVAPVKAGGIILEISGMPLETAKYAARMANYKLPVGTKFVTRLGVSG